MGRVVAVAYLALSCVGRACAVELDPRGVTFEWPPAGGPVIERPTIGENLTVGDFETDWEGMRALGWSYGTWTGGPTREQYPGNASKGPGPGPGRDGSMAFRLTIAPGSHKVTSSYVRVTVPVNQRGLPAAGAMA